MKANLFWNSYMSVGLRFKEAEKFSHILSPYSLFLFQCDCPFIMLETISQCWACYDREFIGKIVCQTQGGKLIWGLEHLVKQLGFQNHQNAWSPVCRCLETRNNMRTRIYCMCWQNVAVDSLANGSCGVVLAKLLACFSLFTAIMIRPRLTSGFSRAFFNAKAT